MRKREIEQEDTLTADDWRALYLAVELVRQISLYGRPALLKFAHGILEAEGT